MNTMGIQQLQAMQGPGHLMGQTWQLQHTQLQMQAAQNQEQLLMQQLQLQQAQAQAQLQFQQGPHMPHMQPTMLAPYAYMQP